MDIRRSSSTISLFFSKNKCKCLLNLCNQFYILNAITADYANSILFIQAHCLEGKVVKRFERTDKEISSFTLTLV